MNVRGDWLIYTKSATPGRTPAGVKDAVQSWLERHEVAELALEPLDGYYAIHINADPKPVPGVFVPASLLDDAEAMAEILEAAYGVWDRELAAH